MAVFINTFHDVQPWQQGSSHGALGGTHGPACKRIVVVPARGGAAARCAGIGGDWILVGAGWPGLDRQAQALGRRGDLQERECSAGYSHLSCTTKQPSNRINE